MELIDTSLSRLPEVSINLDGHRLRTTSGPAWLLVMVVTQAACAGQPPPVPVVPAASIAANSLPALPRSSIAAVVQHRAELGLSDDQVRELELRDLEREHEDAAVRGDVEKRRNDAQTNAAGPGNAVSTGSPGNGGRGGSGPRGGGMRGGGMRNFGGHQRQGTATASDPGQSLQDRLDASDTKAYLDIEVFLGEAQREQAREIASDFREQLYDRRAQAAKAK